MNKLRSLILALVLSAGFAPAFAQAPAPVPALPDAERRTSYVISGSVCNCAVGFQLYQDSTDVANWLKVYINGVEIPQSGNWNITSPSGSIATLPRPITNAVLTFTTARTGTVQIVGAQRPRRLSEYAENRGVAARDLNQAINGIEAQLREMWDRQFRVVQAPPGETLSLLPPQASRASMGACFDSGGNLAPCVAATGSFIAGSGIGFTGSSPTTISYTGATYSAGAGIIFTGSNPTVISAATNISYPVIATRAAAIALNLSAYSVIETGGYATAADGGRAFFKNVGAAPFQDSRVLTGTISAAGTAYTNGTYRGVKLTGGTGNSLVATITVAGTVVTSVVITGTGGSAYTVSDVLTTANANIGGTGSGFTWTVSTISTPLGSFTDSSGARWQIVSDPLGVNIRQFGAKQDWTGTDGSATNDYNSIQAALNFAGITSGPTPDAGGIDGGAVIIPKGASLICGGLNTILVPGSTIFRGIGVNNSTLKVCDSGMNSAVHIITLCDPETQKACFGAKVADFTIYTNNNPASNANIASIYSNNVQQLEAIDRVAIYSGLRSCVRFETGYGGAAYVGLRNVFCTPWPTTTNPGINIFYGTTLVGIRDTVVESGGSGATINGLQVTGGFVEVTNFHSEGISSPIFVNIPTSNIQGIVRVRNVTGGFACTSLVTRQVGSGTSTLTVASAVNNGCTNTVNNAGALTTTIVVTETVY